MEHTIIRAYQFLFARRNFRPLNHLLFQCALRGLGILNYETERLSGEARFLKQWLSKRKGAVVFDVGANVGDYSKLIFSVDSDATVYAFEPHPKTFSLLSANINNPGFHAINCAVGADAGHLTLYDYAEQDGSTHASLYKDVIEQIHHGNAIEHKVEVIPLSPFAQQRQIQTIDLLKIDAEGNELNVLKGMHDLLLENRIRAIHFEFNEMNVVSRSFFKDFWDLLPQYSLFRLLPDGAIPLNEYNPVSCELYAYQNIVAILKSESFDRTGRF